MTNIEMWNMTTMGYAPMRLLLGTSVYSLGFVGSATSALKTFVRGEINELTRLIYDARENALAIINNEAKEIGADDVVGVKTYVYQLGNGLIEFLAIGTAVKKIPNLKTESAQLPPQAIVVDKDTFFDAVSFNNMASASIAPHVDLNSGKKPINRPRFVSTIIALIFILIYFLISHHFH